MNSERDSSFTDSEAAALLGSTHFPFICRDDMFVDIAAACVEEVRLLSTKDGVLKVPAMGRQISKWESSKHRGDRTCWLTPEFCSLHNLIHVMQLVKRMMKLSVSLRKHSGRDEILKSYSVQLAHYPGQQSGYTRHLDSFAPDCEDGDRRQLTMIYYLNCRESLRGGTLRVYVPEKFQQPGIGMSAHVDVEPILGTLVAFQSETVEHEVMPAHSDRMAITMWVSGKGSLPTTSANVQTLSLKKVAETVGPSSSLLSPISASSEASTYVQNALVDSSSFGLSSSHKEQHSRASIFVSIASYRDSELKHTLASLFDGADVADRVMVGVVLQTHPTDDPTVFGIGLSEDSEESGVGTPIQQWLKHNVRVLHVPAAEARGPCVARAHCLSLWREEEFFLQIDAHMRFRRSWDTYLLHIHASADACTAEHEEAVITTYPSGYTLSADDAADENDHHQNCALPPSDIRPTVLVPSHFDSDGMLRQSGKVLRDVQQSPVRVNLWAAGFSFSRARPMVEWAPYDSRLEDLFFGEEVSIAVRLFTHGAVFFAPPQAVIYHLWSRSHRPAEPAGVLSIPHRAMDRQLRRNVSLKIVRLLLGMYSLNTDNTIDSGQRDIDITSQQQQLGTVRSLRDFEVSTGISFRDEVVSEAAKRGQADCTSEPLVFAFDILGAISAQPNGVDIANTRDNCNPLTALKLVHQFLDSTG